MHSKSLQVIEDKLKELKASTKYEQDYFIPARWLDYGSNEVIKINPYEFFLDRIDTIKKLAKENPIKLPDNWTLNSIIYNLFPRFTTCFDHNQDGKIEIPANKEQFKEIGTFLKCIALLPYLHNLGINTLYLLPITSIGVHNRKGNLGSPYSIKNPLKLDENLNETVLDLPINLQFSALVESAHLLGMKVVLEFVFRTASIDSDLALLNPEWFYWIKMSDKKQEVFSPPYFTEEQLKKIKQKVEKNDFENLIPPPKSYIQKFTDIPKFVIRKDNVIIGILEDKSQCTIPSAFADWPPDDNQPLWTDITYLRLFSHPSFNYIAYNTVRMYDKKLLQKKYIIEELWQYICDIIPYYQRKFNIDGILIDMGHALPKELRARIVKSSRKNKPNFVLWEENFVISESSSEEGYDAVVGYLPFDEHIDWKIKNYIRNCEKESLPLPPFATCETHNTKRAMSRFNNIEFSKMIFAMNCFLPGLLFILTGFELAEELPINTGLGFEDEEIAELPPEKLPLFSISQMNWTTNNSIFAYCQKLIEIRKKFVDCKANLDNKTIKLIETPDKVIAFTRNFNEIEILILANFSDEKQFISLDIPSEKEIIVDEITGLNYHLNNSKLEAEFSPFQIVICQIK